MIFFLCLIFILCSSCLSYTNKHMSMSFPVRMLASQSKSAFFFASKARPVSSSITSSPCLDSGIPNYGVFHSNTSLHTSPTVANLSKGFFFQQSRGISTSSHFSEEAFKYYRSFKNGQQFTKKFVDCASQFTVSVAYNPKDRLGSKKSDEGGFVAEFKKMTRQRAQSGMKNTIYEPGTVDAASIDATTSPTGEDNYVCAASDSGVMIGVLDGVGGWSEQGYDSSAISRELSRAITKEYLTDPSLPISDILEIAFESVQKSGRVQVGSTTASFGIVDSKAMAFTALNLGDSWFGIFRKQENGRYKCFYESKEQVYYFNAPYQLSIIPDQMIQNAKKKGSGFLRNVPADADFYSVKLQPEDVVIFSTDGMIDNISPQDIEIYLNDALLSASDPQRAISKVNKSLVDQTVTLANNPNFSSVFSQRLSKATGQHYIGGKPDDITAVMMYVKA